MMKRLSLILLVSQVVGIIAMNSDTRGELASGAYTPPSGKHDQERRRRDYRGSSPTSSSLQRGESSLGIDPAMLNEQDDEGNTALHNEVLDRQLPRFRDLVKQGARYDIKNNDGKTALDLIREEIEDPKEKKEYLLVIQEKDNQDQRDAGATPSRTSTAVAADGYYVITESSGESSSDESSETVDFPGEASARRARFTRAGEATRGDSDKLNASDDEEFSDVVEASDSRIAASLASEAPELVSSVPSSDSSAAPQLAVEPSVAPDPDAVQVPDSSVAPSSAPVAATPDPVSGVPSNASSVASRPAVEPSVARSALPSVPGVSQYVTMEQFKQQHPAEAALLGTLHDHIGGSATEQDVEARFQVHLNFTLVKPNSRGQTIEQYLISIVRQAVEHPDQNRANRARQIAVAHLVARIAGLPIGASLEQQIDAAAVALPAVPTKGSSPATPPVFPASRILPDEPVKVKKGTFWTASKIGIGIGCVAAMIGVKVYLNKRNQRTAVAAAA